MWHQWPAGHWQRCWGRCRWSQSWRSHGTAPGFSFFLWPVDEPRTQHWRHRGGIRNSHVVLSPPRPLLRPPAAIHTQAPAPRWHVCTEAPSHPQARGSDLWQVSSSASVAGRAGSVRQRPARPSSSRRDMIRETRWGTSGCWLGGGDTEAGLNV